MVDKKKIMKRFLIGNIIILAVMCLFCFQNSHMDIPGACDECCSFTKHCFFFSKVVVGIQMLLAILMMYLYRNMDDDYNFTWIGAIGIICIFFSCVQILAFMFNPGVMGHDNLSGEGLKIEKMMDIQILAAKIINVVLIVMYIAMNVLCRRKEHNMENVGYSYEQ